MFNLLCKMIYKFTKDKSKDTATIRLSEMKSIVQDEMPRIMEIILRVSREESEYLNYLTKRIKPIIVSGLLIYLQGRGKTLCQQKSAKNAKQ